MQDMGTKPVQEYITADGLYAVDIALFVRGGTSVAIEVDGPSHFAKNDEEHVLGDTVARRRTLVACGWVVISVPFYVWQRLSTINARRAWLQRMLVGAVKTAGQGPGAASAAAAAAGGMPPAVPTLAGETAGRAAQRATRGGDSRYAAPAARSRRWGATGPPARVGYGKAAGARRWAESGMPATGGVPPGRSQNKTPVQRPDSGEMLED